MRNHLSRAVLALLAFALAAVTTAAPAHGTPAHAPKGVPGAAFGIETATNGKPDGRSVLNYSATPGAVLRDQVAVVNLSSKPIVLRSYVTDATSAGDGSFALLPTGQRPRDVGTWLHLGNRGTVRVPGRTSGRPGYVIVPMSLHVPQHATPGDHAGGVVVSLQGTAITTQGDRAKLDQRVGMRVYIRVSGKVHAALSVDGLAVSYRGPGLFGNPFGDGSARVTYRVHNTGNVVLGAIQRIDVSSWLGGTVELKTLPLVPPLLPGASVSVSREVSGVFPGVRLTASVHLTPQVPAGASDPKLGPVTASTSVWALPWALIVLAVVIIALVVAAFILWRRNRRQFAARTTTSHRRTATSPRKGSSHRPAAVNHRMGVVS